METAKKFLDTSRFFLTGYLNDLNHCLNIVSEEDLWWRPNEESNSIGNLLLHVQGSLSQWILAGIAGMKIHRERHQEFGERSALSKEDLSSKLNSTMHDVDQAIAEIDPSHLTNKMQIAGKEVSWMFAIYLMVQHVSTHTGQIILITKSRLGKDLDLPQFIDQLP
jgi:hypothetical protein